MLVGVQVGQPLSLQEVQLELLLNYIQKHSHNIYSKPLNQQNLQNFQSLSGGHEGIVGNFREKKLYNEFANLDVLPRGKALSPEDLVEAAHESFISKKF